MPGHAHRAEASTMLARTLLELLVLVHFARIYRRPPGPSNAMPMAHLQITSSLCGSFRRFRVSRLDLAEDFTLVAKQDDAPPAPNPAGELRRAVSCWGGGAAW